ncbi:MAG: hypothetical protein LKG16_02260 [Bifidobacterium subtile]|jgi:hypothetical protein|nr:hypothetical protein [Bifidobacterium subtile]MCI1258042.1 hypothetical protein [Bifidobacterium subtile]
MMSIRRGYEAIVESAAGASVAFSAELPAAAASFAAATATGAVGATGAVNPVVSGKTAPAGGAAPHAAERGTGRFISGAIVMENLRRLWPLALVGLAALLVSGPVALVLSDSESRSWTLRMFLEDANVGFVGYQVVFPALIAVMLFRYLDSTGKTNAIHALPVTRTALFASNALSGLVLVAVPQLLLTLSLLPFVRLGSHGFSDRVVDGNSYAFGIYYADDPKTAISDIGTLLRWLLVSAIAIALVYAFSVLASVATGNAGIAFVVAALLNGIVAAAYAIVNAMARAFLYGFPPSGLSRADWLHPVGYLMANGTHMSNVTALLVFVAAGVAALIGAGLLYRAFRSERAGDAVAFRGFEVAVSILVVFLGMCLLGFIFIAIGNGNAQSTRPPRALFLFGAVIGAMVSFVVITMLLRKTTKVFDMASFRRFGVFAVLAALFLTMTTVDVTGYERRVPKQTDVSSVTVNLGGMPLRPFYGQTITLTDPHAISELRTLHGQIATQRPEVPKGNSASDGDWYWSGSIGIEYTLASHAALPSHSTLRREYAIDDTFLRGSQPFADLLNSSGYRQANSIERIIGYDHLGAFTVSGFAGGSAYDYDLPGISAGELMFSSHDAQTLAALLDEDYRSLPAQQLTDMFAPSAPSDGSSSDSQDVIGLQFMLRDQHPDVFDGNPSGAAGPATALNAPSGFYYGVTKQYTRSIAWLKAKGYYERLVKASQALQSTGSAQGL